MREKDVFAFSGFYHHGVAGHVHLIHIARHIIMDAINGNDNLSRTRRKQLLSEGVVIFILLPICTVGLAAFILHHKIKSTTLRQKSYMLVLRLRVAAPGDRPLTTEWQA